MKGLSVHEENALIVFRVEGPRGRMYWLYKGEMNAFDYLNIVFDIVDCIETRDWRAWLGWK
jgi:hypothetical protein